MAIPLLAGVHFEHTLLRSKGWNLVLFASASCGACKRLRPLLPQLAFDEPVQLWEVDAHAEPALAARFGVFYLPALVLFDGVDFHAVVPAQLDPGALAAEVERLRREPAQEEP